MFWRRHVRYYGTWDWGVGTIRPGWGSWQGVASGRRGNSCRGVEVWNKSIKQLGTGGKTLSTKTGLCKGPMRKEAMRQSRARARNHKAGQDASTAESYTGSTITGRLKWQQGPHQVEACRPRSRSNGEPLQGFSLDSWDHTCFVKISLQLHGTWECTMRGSGQGTVKWISCSTNKTQMVI